MTELQNDQGGVLPVSFMLVMNMHSCGDIYTVYFTVSLPKV